MSSKSGTTTATPSKSSSVTSTSSTTTNNNEKSNKELKKEKKELEKIEKAQAKELKKEKRVKEKQAKKDLKAAKKHRRTGSNLSSAADEDDSDTDDGSLTSSTNNADDLSTSGTGVTISLESNRGIYSTLDQQEKTNIISEREIFSSESFLIALSDTDHLGPAIKSVFENNKEQEVIQTLETYIEQKNSDIEKICGDNHEGFINSVTAFLALKQDNTSLKHSVITLNDQLQDSGKRFVEKADQLFTCKREKDNIRKTKEIINNCQYAILLGMKIEEYIKEKRYYLAIKNMDQLHNVYLKRLKDFQFARNMDQSSKIGRFGMIQSAKKLEKEREINPLKIKTSFGESETTWDNILDIPVNDNPSIIGYLSTTTNRQEASSPSLIKKDDLGNDEISQVSPFDEAKIDFHPLYQCLFIFSNLGLLEEFQAYYTMNRLLQFNLVIQPKEIGQVWESFLQQIAGYFMIESKVMDSTHPYLSKTTINDCWNTALVKITSLLQELVTHCHDTQSLIAFKKFVLVFTNTLSFYSYHVQPLFYLLETMKEKYCQFAIKEGVDLFTRILENESNINLYIETKQDYDTLIKSNNLDKIYGSDQESSEQKEKSKEKELLLNTNTSNTTSPLFDPISNLNNDIEVLLPKSFEFSKLVPQFYTLIKKFISEFYEFADQLTENENFIIRSTDTLIKKINEVLHNHLTLSQAVPQVCQLVINLHHLLHACNFFKDYLNSLILGDNKGGIENLSQNVKVTLSSSNQIYTTKGIGEKLIIKLCEKNIDDLMSSSANINWAPNASDDRPREYVDDVCIFLDVTIPFVLPLSPTLREEFMTKSFKKISETLYNILFSESIKRINLIGVKWFNTDLKRIEEFAKIKASEKERNTTSSRNIVGYFYEIRQVVNLLLSDNPEEFADPKTKSRNYNLITNIPQIIALFQKYKEESSLFGQTSGNQRNTKISNAIKKFKEMQ
ncbi:exocyst complex subunit 6 [Cavenderia fasciculata]|uniref:Exocyst complex component n=1 Tax=Cavenderia fasciculata TaxID=261658 RepID=F4Q787_CACFS|nr:exocyst complex subunit 6 [Cavenderia fasciculata]EGG16269.1 exocyst complex subunit 6 [Cavenderia fasciculata]|eukprot:XP_004354653.1 exocyst complex subunit 6 [Cavenderia fasciculata]